MAELDGWIGDGPPMTHEPEDGSPEDLMERVITPLEDENRALRERVAVLERVGLIGRTAEQLVRLEYALTESTPTLHTRPPAPGGTHE